MLHYTSNLDPKIQLAFTTQREGNLALHVNDDPRLVEQNRASLEDRIGVRRFSLHFMNQVHSALVHRVSTQERHSWHEPLAPTCDGLVSPHGAEALAVMVADCLPVLFVGSSPATATVSTAATHAGRRGLMDGILQNTVAELRDTGATEIEAVIGPAICGSCYEVPESMAVAAEQTVPGIRTRTRWGSNGLDLPGAATRILEADGIKVRQSGHCTLEDSQYFSYRRQNPTGRLAGLVWRQE